MGKLTPSPVTALGDLYMTGLGLKAWSHDPRVQAAATAPTSQLIYVVAVPLRAGTVVTNICFQTVTAAGGTAPTAIYVGLADSAGVILRKSADEKANAQWTAAAALVQIPLTSAYTITSDALYYAVILQNGTWGTTQMTLSRGTGGWNPPTSGKFAYAAAGTGQTVLPNEGVALGAYSNSSALAYFAAVS